MSEREKHLPWVAMKNGRPVIREGGTGSEHDLINLARQGGGPYALHWSAVLVTQIVNRAQKVAVIRVRVDGGHVYSGNPGNAVNFSEAVEAMRAECAIVVIPLGDDGSIPEGDLKDVKISFDQPLRRVRELPWPRLVLVLNPSGYPAMLGSGQSDTLHGMFNRAVDSLPFCPSFPNGATVMVVCQDRNPERTVWEVKPFRGTHLYHTSDPACDPDSAECSSLQFVRTTVGERDTWTMESRPMPAATPAPAAS